MEWSGAERSGVAWRGVKWGGVKSAVEWSECVSASGSESESE